MIGSVTRVRSSTALGVLAALALAVAPSARAAAPVVKEVRIEGNRRVEVDAIRAAISQKPGEPLDASKVDKDIRAIMKLGFFSDVVVDAEDLETAPVLVYHVTERPTVRDVKVVGNEELSKDDLKDAIELKPFSVLDLGQVRKDVKKIKEKYVEKGYFLADVSYKLQELPDNQVDVLYTVVEKAKVQVKEVRFLGNAHVPKDDITPYMQTQEGGLPLLHHVAGHVQGGRLPARSPGGPGVYMDRGFVNVKVGKPSVALSPDRRFLFVTIPVEEGEQYRHREDRVLRPAPRSRSRCSAASSSSKQGERFPRSKVGAGHLRDRRRVQGPRLRLRERLPAHQRRPEGADRST